jgi:hypothetical protein
VVAGDTHFTDITQAAHLACQFVRVIVELYAVYPDLGALNFNVALE